MFAHFGLALFIRILYQIYRYKLNLFKFLFGKMAFNLLRMYFKCPLHRMRRCPDKENAKDFWNNIETFQIIFRPTKSIKFYASQILRHTNSNFATNVHMVYYIGGKHQVISDRVFIKSLTINCWHRLNRWYLCM